MIDDRQAQSSMHLLDPTGFARVAPLVPPHTQAGHMAFAWALLEGRQSGHVWVDDANRPRSAIVCNDCEFWFVLGEPRPDLVAGVMPELLRRLPTNNTALWCTSPEWETALAPLFAQTSHRKEFHFEPEKAEITRVALPPRLRLAPIDAAIAARFKEPYLDPWVARVAWGDPEQMAAKSFGWAVMDGDRPVSFCAACAIGGPRGAVEAEIEIITDADYRGRDLATAAALAFFASCRERGMVP
ncbi:MAG: GNAT family N-acetyltransferase, partial [Dehalococcoidia bacterium]|nr:GNAT family N-acetyltransferase [Dehalococcoidia bacterium]